MEVDEKRSTLFPTRGIAYETVLRHSTVHLHYVAASPCRAVTSLRVHGHTAYCVQECLDLIEGTLLPPAATL